jgi:hypothetical protein
MDGGTEYANEEVRILLAGFGVKQVQVTAYHPMGNGQIENGHTPILNALAKLTKGTMVGWRKHLPAVFWADRTTVKRTTGYSPADLLYGHEVILPVEVELGSFNTLDWGKFKDTATLLAYRAQQLSRRNDEMPEIMDRQARARQSNKEWFDQQNSVTLEDIEPGTLVLVRRDELIHSRSHKLAYRWRGPYRVRTVNASTCTYVLEELDGTEFVRPIARRRLRAIPTLRPTVQDTGILDDDDFSEEDRDIAFVDVPTIQEDVRAEYEFADVELHHE